MKRITNDTDGLFDVKTTFVLESTNCHSDDVLGTVQWDDEATVGVSKLGSIHMSVQGGGHAYTPVDGNSSASAFSTTILTPQEARTIAIALLTAADAAEVAA